MTKLQMAQTITQALYNLKTLPPATNCHVKRFALLKKSQLADFVKSAKIITDLEGK